MQYNAIKKWYKNIKRKLCEVNIANKLLRKTPHILKKIERIKLKNNFHVVFLRKRI